MPLLLEETINDVTVDTTEGTFGLHEYFGGGWGLLFAHPGDFLPVSTTELGEVARLAPEFEQRNVRVIALSCDTMVNHSAWAADVKAATGMDVAFPIISDPGKDVAVKLRMIPMEAKEHKGYARPVRSVLLVGPDKKVKASLTYPMCTGYNFFEIIRVIDSLQLSLTEAVHTPVNWVNGGDVVVAPEMRTDPALERFTRGVRIIDVPSRKEYLRMTPQPAPGETAALTNGAADDIGAEAEYKES